jgi:hypothetical protein
MNQGSKLDLRRSDVKDEYRVGESIAPLQVRRRSTGLTEPRIKPIEFLFALVALALPIAFVGWIVQQRIADAVRQQTAHDLHATLEAAVSGVELWMETCERVHRAATQDSRVLEAAACYAAHGEEACLSHLKTALLPYSSATLGGAYLAAPVADGVWTVAGESLRHDRGAALLGALRAAQIDGQDPKYVSPFALGTDNTLSGFASHLSPGLVLFTEVSAASLSRSLLAARAGDTGETYALDAAGHMITESRFSTQLREMGLLFPNEASTVLQLDVRDPGIDLRSGKRAGMLRSQQPLTRMAASLTSGISTVDVEGYRDYRGVRVFGAWHWLAQYRIGIATEVDEDEAWEPVAKLRWGTTWALALLGVIGSALVTTALVSRRARDRAKRALARIDELGQYRIERKLGEGGMGEVYLARHVLLRRPTAVKVLRRDRNDENAFTRFEREVQTTSELFHPNTVAIYDYGRSADGTFFYAMEYLEGLDVDRLVKRCGPLPDGRVVYLLTQACASLEEAHRRGLVHRDIKPSNLFVCQREGAEDLLKVLDFGIVKAPELTDARITHASTIIGTPEFMSPEMFDRAGSVSAQSDIYSLGAVAYFMLTGKALFDALTIAELCTAHLMDEPAPPSLRGGRVIDPALEQIVMACLAKSPRQRPGGAGELRKLLENLSCAHAWTRDDARRFWKELNDSASESSV